AVFLVHVRDRRAAFCPADEFTACDRAFVVDRVVWTGDATTATAPLTIQDVLRRLASIGPGPIRATPFDPSAGASGACDPGWPAQSWTAVSLDVGRILVFPRTEDVRAVVSRLT